LLYLIRIKLVNSCIIVLIISISLIIYISIIKKEGFTTCPKGKTLINGVCYGSCNTGHDGSVPAPDFPIRCTMKDDNGNGKSVNSSKGGRAQASTCL